MINIENTLKKLLWRIISCIFRPWDLALVLWRHENCRVIGATFLTDFAKRRSVPSALPFLCVFRVLFWMCCVKVAEFYEVWVRLVIQIALSKVGYSNRSRSLLLIQFHLKVCNFPLRISPPCSAILEWFKLLTRTPVLTFLQSLPFGCCDFLELTVV
jgi:hypothetical protein